MMFKCMRARDKWQRHYLLANVGIQDLTLRDLKPDLAVLGGMCHLSRCNLQIVLQLQ